MDPGPPAPRLTAQLLYPLIRKPGREVWIKGMFADNSPEYLASLWPYADPEFFKAIVPAMRRDFPLLKSYRFRPSPPLTCPMTAFAPRVDNMVYTDEIGEWSRYAGGGLEFIEVDGGHWFLTSNHELIMSTLRAIAARCRDRQTLLLPAR